MASKYARDKRLRKAAPWLFWIGLGASVISYLTYLDTILSEFTVLGIALILGGYVAIYLGWLFKKAGK